MQQLRKTLNPKPTEDWFWVDLERKKEKTLPSFEFFSCFFPFFFLLFSSFFYFSLLPCFCFALILCLLVGFLPFVHGQQQAQVFFGLLCRLPSSIVVISTSYHHLERYSLFFFLGFDFLSHFFVCLRKEEEKKT